MFEELKDNIELNTELTPVIEVGGGFLKRDDLFIINGIAGGKVRTCYALAVWAKKNGYIGLSTAGSRSSPQVNIVAHIAQYLNMECHIHTPKGDLSKEVLNAINVGAEITQHKAGYNSVIVARSRDFAKTNNYFDIPFGMECDEAVRQTRYQVQNIPKDIKRIVMPVGSAMSLCGVLHGLNDIQHQAKVIGVKVGADPMKRILKYAPANWISRCILIDAGVDYSEYVDQKIGGVVLDPVYEAKAFKFVKAGDLFWIVGCRQTYINKKFNLMD